MELLITEIKIFPRTGDDDLKAVCSVTFNGCLTVFDIKIKTGSEGLYVCFPTYHDEDGETRPAVLPITKEVRKEISNRVLATYVINHCCETYQF